ncbi:MAG: hypothetical protein HXY30_20235 [Pseudorhodoplanes sp.]|nr:hypothetical protein [Pseudorhodoplanes sp.]
MMSIPFFLLALGLVGAAAGNRGAAFGLWTAGIVATLILFRLHATDSLTIGL